jgi:hypothetical protein
MQNDKSKCKKLSEGDVIVEGEYENEDSPQIVADLHRFRRSGNADVRSQISEEETDGKAAVGAAQGHEVEVLLQSGDLKFEI